jgi:hypothetical protein
MEVLFFIIFGGVLAVFAAYGIKIYKEDKKILDDIKEQDEMLPEDEQDFIAIEHPYYDYYKGFY